MLEDEEGVAVDWGDQMVMEAVGEREVTEEGRKDEGGKMVYIERDKKGIVCIIIISEITIVMW